MQRAAPAALFCFSLAAIFLLSIQFNRLDLFDSASYINTARYIAENGSLPAHNFFARRLTVIIPVAVCIKLFGSAHIKWLLYVTKAQFFVLLLLLFLVLRKWSTAVAWFAFLLVGLSQICLQNASLVNSDLPVTLFANAPLLVFFYYWKTSKVNAPLWGVCAGVLFVIGVLAKESAVFYLPLFFYLALRNLSWKHQKWLGIAVGIILLGYLIILNEALLFLPILFWICLLLFFIKKCGALNLAGADKFWRYLLVMAIAGGAGIMWWYWISTGNPLHRITTYSSQNTGDNIYMGVPLSLKFLRMTIQPFIMMVEDFGFGVMLLFSIMNLAGRNPEEESRFFQISLLFTMATWWVGTLGFRSWVPVMLAHRVWLPLIVPMAVNAAYFLSNIHAQISRKQKLVYSIISLLFLASAIAGLKWSKQLHSTLNVPQHFTLVEVAYFTVVLVLNLALWVKVPANFALNLNSGHPLGAVIIFIMFMGLIYQYRYANYNYMLHFDEEKDLAVKLEQEVPAGTRVITDPAMALNYSILYNHEPKLNFTNLQDVDSIKSGDCLFIQKERMERLVNNVNQTVVFRRAQVKVPFYVLNPAAFGLQRTDSNSTAEVWQRK